MELSTIKNSDKWGNSTARLNENFSKISTEVDKMKFAAYNSKLYPSLAALQEEIPSPEVGDWAIVGDTIPGDIYRCEVSGEWKATGEQGGGFAMEVVEKHVTENYSNVFNNPVSVVNNPDNEDIQSVGEVGKEVLQFADKTYEKTAFSGFGRVYLRKNLYNQKNVLSQEMVKSANTIYNVQYDYDLDGNVLEMPDGCVLDFCGGSISNGSLSFSKPCTILADRQVFSGVMLEKGSQFSDCDINPIWFGVVGDGVTDDTGAIRYMLSFCKNIYNVQRESRNGADFSPRIVFKKNSYYKITGPICIDFLCHILGNPVFLYTGEDIAEDVNDLKNTGAAVIITEQRNTTFEFSVIRLKEQYVGADNVTTDLSGNVQFAGVKTGNCIWCNFKIHQIFGFNTGVYMLCNGMGSTWQCIFDVHYIAFTLNAFIVNTVNNGWSNGNKICNTIFLGQSNTDGHIIVPANFSHGAFLKFIGDGSYGANSWIIDNIQIETKIAAAYPIYFMEIKLDAVTSGKIFRDFSISNLRLEGIGDTISSGIFMKSNMPHGNISISSILYSSVYTMQMDYYGLETSLTNPVVSIAGIVYSSSMVYGIEFNFKSMSSMLYYCGQYYNIDDKVRLVGLQADYINSGSISTFNAPSYIWDIKNGQLVKLSKKPTGRAYIIFYDSQGQRIDVPDGMEYSDSVYATGSTGYKKYLMSSADSVQSIYFMNKSGVDYRFAVICLDDYRLDSNMQLVSNGVSRLNTSGEEADKPNLQIGIDCDGFEYYNTSTGRKEIYVNGQWQNISGSSGAGSSGYSFSFDYVKQCLWYLNGYYNIDKRYRLVGVSNGIPSFISSLNHLTTVGERLILSAGQKISFSKKNKNRMYIVFYNSDGTRIDKPSDISFDNKAMYEVAQTNRKYLQANTDQTTSGYIQNDSGTEYQVSFILLDDYTLSSNMTIQPAYNSNPLKFAGNTSERPSLSADNKGYQYYDTALGKPIWWNGSTWTDSNGTII